MVKPFITFLAVLLLTPLLAKAEFNYVAMGASDATGIGATPITNGYVYRIARGLESCGADPSLTNVGIPGAQLHQVKNIELPLAILFQPKLVTLWPGPNDLVRGRTSSSFRSLLRQVLAGLASYTEALVVLANIPDLTQLPAFLRKPDRDVTHSRITSFNRIIKQEARRHGFPVVNIARQPVSPSLVNDRDGFHPSNAGYAAIGDEFLKVISPQFCG